MLCKTLFKEPMTFPNNFNDLFSDFVKVIQDTVDFYTPYKKQGKLKLKPFIIKGLLTLIKHNQKLYIASFIQGNFDQKPQFKKKCKQIKFVSKKLFYQELKTFSISCFSNVEYY